MIILYLILKIILACILIASAVFLSGELWAKNNGTIFKKIKTFICLSFFSFFFPVKRLEMKKKKYMETAVLKVTLFFKN